MWCVLGSVVLSREAREGVFFFWVLVCMYVGWLVLGGGGENGIMGVSGFFVVMLEALGGEEGYGLGFFGVLVCWLVLLVLLVCWLVCLFVGLFVKEASCFLVFVSFFFW